VFLGSGDAFGSGGRLQTCLLVRNGEGGLLIDCGATSLVALRRAGVDPGSIGAVVLTHLHGDHFAGLPFLILDGQFTRRTAPLVIAGPPGTRQRIAVLMETMFPGSTAIARRFAVEYVELADRSPCEVGPARVTALPVVHASGAPAYALRVEYRGRVVAYSGDTEWTESLVEAAREADLFACEAYSIDKPIRYHLDYRTLDQHRHRLTCRRLVLTHLGKEVLERRDEVALECAEDGMIIRLPAAFDAALDTPEGLAPAPGTLFARRPSG
jgi:ribonuclease BN (tRNA processing enzyme)